MLPPAPAVLPDANSVAPPIDGPTRLQRLQAKVEEEVRNHNELHSQIEESEKQIAQARNRLYQIQGRVELLNEQIEEERREEVGPPENSAEDTSTVEEADTEDK